MNATHCKRGTQSRYPHRNHFLIALFVAVMMIISTAPAFAVEATANASTPDTEILISTSDLGESHVDEEGTLPDEVDDSEPTSEPTPGPVTTIEELLDAIAHANANDVIEFDGYIQASSPELVLGRADCPVTIRRATSEAKIFLYNQGDGSIRVQNITFDGAGIQAVYSILETQSPTQIFEKCHFVNCIASGTSALRVSSSDTALFSDCHFANNKGFKGAHLFINNHKTTIENCTFTDGYARDTGAVYINLGEETSLAGCTISGNAAGVQGGGIYIADGELSIVGCKIYGNTANGVADDITKNYRSRLSLADDYLALVDLYRPDGVIPNRWTVDSHYDLIRGTAPYCADMIFSMTFVDNEPSPLPPPSPTSITLNKSELTLEVGETDTLTATLYPEGTSSSIQWTSSDPAVASVSESGLITAHSAGTTSITATATVGGASASCHVNVQAMPAKSYSISINVSPVGGGIVRGNGWYEEGAIATITAVPNEDFRFLAWVEADTQISTESSLTLTVSSDRTLTAVFEPISKPAPEPVLKPVYAINVIATVGGTVTGEGTYEQGSSVTLTAIPENGYLFIGWTEDGEQISTDERFTFTVNNDRNLTAVFEPIPDPTPEPIPKSTYTINTSATVGGTVSGGGKYEQGSSVTLTATPENGYLFIGWTENNEQISTNESLTFIADHDRTLVGNFAPVTQPTYTINVSATEGGTASGGGEYEQRSSVTLTATPESEYLFMGWTEDGEQVSTDECFTFLVDCDRTLVANFTPIPKPIYTIWVNSTSGGIAEGGDSYEQGELVTVNAVPDDGYRFLYWEENGEQISTEESFTFIADHDRTLVANFEPIPRPIYTIQLRSTQGGIVEGGGSYEEGEFVTVNAVPDNNYRFLHWEESSEQVCTEAQYSFISEADRTLAAIFELIPQSVLDSTHVPSHNPGIPSISRDSRPIATSMPSQEEVKQPALTNGKAVLIAPDDLFWVGYKTGRDNGTETVTRADLAQLVYSMMDNEIRKIYGATRSPFRDVELGVWYEAAVGAMLDTGIMVGCGDGLFCPNRTLTWGELLTVFARFTEDKPLTEYYTGGHWAKDAVNKAVTLGWLEYSEALDPGSLVTTSEMVDLIQAVFRWNNQ